MNKSKCLSILYKTEDIILLTCLSVMGLSIFIQVILRYIFNFPLTWSEELARYLHVWITFLGLGYGIRNKAHIKVEFFYERLGKKNKKIITILTNIFMIFCFLYFLPGTLRFLSNQDLIVSSAMGVKMSIVYIVLPVGIIVSVLHFILDTIITFINLINPDFLNDGEGRGVGC